MCLEFKKPKEKNKSFTCTLTCSKQCTRDVFITDWNQNSKRRLINVFTVSATPRKAYGWWIFTLNYKNKSTEESFMMIKH